MKLKNNPVINVASPTNNPTNPKNHQHAFRLMAYLALITVTFMPEIALAAPWDSVGTKVLSIFTNGLTRTLAIIAVIALGIAAYWGKMSWERAGNIIIGMTLTFGAAAFVDFIMSAT